MWSRKESVVDQLVWGGLVDGLIEVASWRLGEVVVWMLREVGSVRRFDYKWLVGKGLGVSIRGLAKASYFP